MYAHMLLLHWSTQTVGRTLFESIALLLSFIHVNRWLILVRSTTMFVQQDKKKISHWTLLQAFVVRAYHIFFFIFCFFFSVHSLFFLFHSIPFAKELFLSTCSYLTQFSVEYITELLFRLFCCCFSSSSVFNHVLLICSPLLRFFFRIVNSSSKI